MNKQQRLFGLGGHLSFLLFIFVDNLVTMLVEPNDPSVVGTMGFVQHLNTEELKALLNDEGRLEFMIKDCPKVSF